MEKLEVWHFGDDPDEVLKTGKNFLENPNKLPSYIIEITKDISANRKIGILIGYNRTNKRWYPLCERNIQDHTLYKAVKDNKFPLLYIKGYGLWKIAGLNPDPLFAVIEIIRYVTS